MSETSEKNDILVEVKDLRVEFDVRDGSALELPATEPIGCYDVKVVDGEVWVRPHDGLRSRQ